jgi:hypothetical protein
MLFLLFVLLLSSQAVQGSRAVTGVNAGTFRPCNCPQQQPGSDGSTYAASPISMLVGAVDQKHVLMKVRMLPTSAAALLRTVKAGDVRARPSLLALLLLQAVSQPSAAGQGLHPARMASWLVPCNCVTQFFIRPLVPGHMLIMVCALCCCRCQAVNKP